MTMDDRELLFTLDRDPEVMRFISGGRPSTADEVEQTMRRSLGHRWLGFLLEDNKTAEFVGWYGLSPGPGHGDRELGYRLTRQLWGRGLATEGSMALIDHAFNELAATRIWAQTMTVNTASRAVMERCGLTYVRTFHLEWDEPIEGTELGDVEYELTRAEWANVADTARA